ncbi:MAG: YceD family protein [Ornithinimicrobium sp.]
MAHRDEDGPWVFNTRELVRRPGTMREVSRTITSPTAIGTDVIAIAPGADVDVQVRMESVVEGVLATGQVRSAATGECVRCLDDVVVDIDVSVQELFAYSDRAAHHEKVGDTDNDEERHELDQDLMDLEPVVRDAVVTALPFQPVCRDDCPGLCAQCGARFADDPDHQHDLIDPRWAALADLTSSTDYEKRT